MDNTIETHNLLTELANGLRRIKVVVDELGDLGQTTRQVLMNIVRINNAIETTATRLSFACAAAEFARFTELSTKVKNDLEEALKKRIAFTDELKPKNEKAIADFILELHEYKPNGLTKKDVKRAESPAAQVYALYASSLMGLQSDGERLAEWLEGKATEASEKRVDTESQICAELADIKALGNQAVGGINALAKGQKSQGERLKGIEGNTAGLSEEVKATKEAAAGARVAAEDAKAEAAKAAKRPTTKVNAQPGSTVNVVRAPRTDKGGNHRRTARGWRPQAEAAADFSKWAKKIGGKWYGKVTDKKVKDWEARYPDATKRERKSGYHAGLRNVPNPTPETKKAYWEAAANWNAYWEKHNKAFLAWLKTNRNGDHATFLKTWERPGKTEHMNDSDKTMRYGADTSLRDALDSGYFDNET